ncbi:acyl-CoA thioester hydrolase/BAAT C-terminal domain-containing protein [Sphingomonas endolithica]|uniref:acyl-CoA thioester hydrolase/BAAT C-terminal domain-containing protein n=1 Tax=Sphingomonas endolithica TaxID=2972485 RepID=UPI0021B03589|nr:acyl-CoA thioester hydrolase/BAAT C-terminal domain-containing protein [Sphingomonas sp. ZFBP2030]
MLDRRRFLKAGFAAATVGAITGMPMPSFAQQAVIRSDVREAGLVGRLHALPDAQRRTTVIMLNGSDGGLPSARDADDLAQAGYPVLALAYFKDWRAQPEGVPASLEQIPLEYFFGAIDWLKRRPEVDPTRIVVMGLSRGGELALLLGSLRPDLAGVIAYSPSDWVWGGIPAASAPRVANAPVKPAWTLGGRPLAFRQMSFTPGTSMREAFLRAPASEPARIPVERIRGAVLLQSSTADALWPSDVYADEAAARLGKRSGRATMQNLHYADASHLLMGTGPAMTKLQIPGTTFSIDFGGTAEGTIKARAEAWAASKRFLAAL